VFVGRLDLVVVVVGSMLVLGIFLFLFPSFFLPIDIGLLLFGDTLEALRGSVVSREAVESTAVVRHERAKPIAFASLKGDFLPALIGTTYTACDGR